jgi:hypothetical protein
MARYFFHNEDGKCFPDESGVELPDMAAVRHTAMRVLTEMVSAHENEFYENGSWRLTVTDESGLTLFLVDVGLINAAAAPAAKSAASEA